MQYNLRFVLILWLACGMAAASAQLRELPAGFERVTGEYIDVITDMPLSDELRELPQVFDAAIPLWCEEFGVALEEVATWRIEAFMMLDRGRFELAGFIPENVPNFPYGFQYRNQVWVAEQPSAYYRRHLLLHEGTHWFMNRLYGDHGPPWLMEGMAEWLGTHRWNGSQLSLGIIPRDRQDVPYWGRISLIQKQLAEGTAPSLETILRYDNTAHQQVDAYAWSWAAVLFLKHHPDTSKFFKRLFQQPMRSDATLTRWLFARLRERWPNVRQDWNAYVTELEYGYDLSRSMLRTSQPSAPLSGKQVTVRIEANQSWQPAGVSVEAGSTLKISATGEYTVNAAPTPWRCEPSGVTLEYYRGEPLGKLMLAVIAPIDQEPQTTSQLTLVPVGSGGTFTMAKAGKLYFKVNEANAGLADNTGKLTIAIAP